MFNVADDILGICSGCLGLFGGSILLEFVGFVLGFEGLSGFEAFRVWGLRLIDLWAHGSIAHGFMYI